MDDKFYKTHYPVNTDGNMDSYPNSLSTWLLMDKKPFNATMNFVDIETGRSAVRTRLKDENGKIWYMFFNSLEQFIANAKHGELTANWKIVKRGANYGLIIAD